MKQHLHRFQIIKTPEQEANKTLTNVRRRIVDASRINVMSIHGMHLVTKKNYT